MNKPFKETVEERAKRDPEFRKELEEEKMKVSYDFVLDTCVAVDAPIGTNPETLIEQVKAKFVERILSNDVTVAFENIFDGETGAYDEDWENYGNKKDNEKLISRR